MELPLYQVDAFTRKDAKMFSGNPAAVVPLEQWLSDEQMQAIAAENNLSETTFFVQTDGIYHIRWFTPTTEVDLCGHATLAAAQVIVSELDDQRPVIPFTCGIGELSVERDPHRQDLMLLNFPQRPPVGLQDPALVSALEQALGQNVARIAAARDLVVELESAQAVLNCHPDQAALAILETFAVTITAQSAGDYDFVSRFFAPRQGIDEDPVTGSSFCSLAPYWAEKLGKPQLRAWQCSARGGEVELQLTDGRVRIGGSCFTYLRGHIRLP